MIVQSPEKAKRNIEEMAVSLEKERKMTLDYEGKQRELQARVDHMYRINHVSLKHNSVVRAAFSPR